MNEPQFVDVILGENVTVFPNAQLGRPVFTGGTISAASLRRPVRVGRGTIVGCHVVLFEGAEIGEDCLIGDNVLIRENSVIGDRVVLGSGVGIGPRVRIGSQTRIMDQSHITGESTIGDYVFVGVGVITTNDNQMKRSDIPLRGVTIEDHAKVASGVICLPGVTIGHHALVGAGMIVTKNIPPHVRTFAKPGSIVVQSP